jgi:hypothetical protein
VESGIPIEEIETGDGRDRHTDVEIGRLLVTRQQRPDSQRQQRRDRPLVEVHVEAADGDR